MNPLDKEELESFNKIMKKDMPLHTDKTTGMKLTYGQRFPKDLEEYSAKIDNKFLNDNLHTIEEMEHREKGITDGFKEYQTKYYDQSGILNHDLYFTHENKIYPKVSGASPMIMRPARFTVREAGTEFETSPGSTGATGIPVDYLWCSLGSTGTDGGWYDRIACSDGNSLGNKALACYQADGASSIPATLVASEGGNAADSAYTWRTVTEFQINGATSWLALNTDSTSYNFNYTTGGSVNYKSSQTYVTFPVPYGAASGTDTAEAQMKCGHT